ncbi:MAG: FtsW/RodA/SpoVE family cell cycle protein [Bacteroidales bacterium]|nr:FtsW/RodA/SpoVE family cell cycle protein [Bacteroidales bacterium]
MSGKKRKIWNFLDGLEGDKVVWIIALMLIMLSVVCIFSSTSRLLVGSLTRLDLVKTQLLIVLFGLGIIILCYNIKSIGFFRYLSKWGFLISLCLLVLLDLKVNLPFLRSVEINGARRILKIGPLQLHVFEVVKVAMVMYFSWAVDAIRKGEIRFLEGLPEKKRKRWIDIVYIYFPFLSTLLLVLPGSNSAAIFIGGMMFLVILLGGARLGPIFILMGATVALALASWGIYEVSDHKYMKRLGTGIARVFAEDDKYERQALDSPVGSLPYYEAIDKIRQPVSAKIAIREGGILGKGPGGSTQRYVVPDISEDYMYSFIIEEYGWPGALLVLILYVSLLARGAVIVRNSGRELFPKLAVAGLTLLITGQAFLHMFVNADIGPMTGQTLPLISHGNSAFICFCVAFGIILSFSRSAKSNIAREQRAAEPLVDLHAQGADTDALQDLDHFESGHEMDPILTEEEDYEL